MMGAVSLDVLTIESSGLIGLKAQGLRSEHFEASGSMDLGIGLSGEVERSKALQPQTHALKVNHSHKEHRKDRTNPKF